MNILAIKLGATQTLANGAIDTGYRSVLSVRSILARVQTTRFYGDSLYMIWNNVGQLDVYQGYSFFLNQFIKKPKTWGQLSEVPPNPLIRSVYLTPLPAPVPPVAEGTLTLLTSGYDPLKGFWAEFAGNYYLNFPLFREFPAIQREGPNHTGFQSST